MKAWKEYLVHDKKNYIVMVIYPPIHGEWYRIHFPRAENYPKQTPLLYERGAFHEMRLCDIGYMLMAYNEDEFKKFDTFLKEMMEDEAN